MNEFAHAGIYTDFQGLAQLRQAAREQSPEAARETARQFEGLFIQMMLKSMRAATPVEGSFDSQQVRFFQGMFDQQISLSLAGAGGMGLADVLYQQLGGAQSGEGNPRPLRAPYASPMGAHATPSTASSHDVHSESTETPPQFVHRLWPHAVRAGNALGVSPEVLIAQSALETGWGKKVIRDHHGNTSHNLFGIKADPHWRGQKISVGTLEYENGVAVRERAAFRAYDSVADSFDDYVNFIASNGRYDKALKAGDDPEGYLRGLQEAGYATDPRYAEKILRILSQNSFAAQVTALKRSAGTPIA